MNEVSLFRLYLLRALYLLVAIGLGSRIWPGIIHHDKPWQAMEGVVVCMLGAFSALAVVGLRYPLQMLPIIFWELVWKIIWLIVVALPLWSTNTMDAEHKSIAVAVLGVVIIPFAIPWRYALNHYVKKPAERWR